MGQLLVPSEILLKSWFGVHLQLIVLKCPINVNHHQFNVVSSFLKELNNFNQLSVTHAHIFRNVFKPYIYRNQCSKFDSLLTRSS